LGLRLNGTAFVETLGAFDVDGVPYVALERIEGVTVLELWRRTGALSYPAVARIGAEVCQALAVMHVLRDDEGTPLHALHRDISARNVMVDTEGRVRIIDLGAAFSEAADRSAVSRVGVVIGTLSYMPPEIFEGGKDSPARDMWSVGVLLLESAVGSVFSKKRAGEDTIEGLQRVRRKTLDPFSDPAVMGLEPRLLGILKQLLTKNPALRMDAKTAAAEFAALCAGLKPQVELARRVERARQLPKPVASPKAEVAAPPTAARAPSRTEADEIKLDDDGPTIQDPPRRGFESGSTLEDAPTRQDRSGMSPGGPQPAMVDGPSGVARHWPKSPPPPPVTENTFLRLLTAPESGGGVFAEDSAGGVTSTGPTTLGVEPMPAAGAPNSWTAATWT
jgi:serine/threonine-protein kinase